MYLISFTDEELNEMRCNDEIELGVNVNEKVYHPLTKKFTTPLAKKFTSCY